MPKGERRSVQERLDAIVAERKDAMARFEKADGVRANKERGLREKLIREQVKADLNTDLEAEVQRRLAESQNGDATADVEDSYDAQGRYVNV